MPPPTIRTLRRQNTCLRKRVTKHEREKATVRNGQRALKWAHRYIKHGSQWNLMQLKRALKELNP